MSTGTVALPVVRHRRPLVGWLVAEAVSITGTRVSMLAIPLFVLATTGSATRTGLVALVEMLPLVVVKALSGPAIDRIGPRRVAIGCDLASTAVVGAVPLLHDAGLLPFGLFLVLVACAGALRGPGDAAKQALVPTLVAGAGVPLERATGLSAAVERTASMAGAGVAGLLVASVGAANALVVDAVSFALSAGLLAWSTAGLATVRPDPAGAAATAGASDDAPYLARLREGWDFLRTDRLLLAIALMVALTNLLDLAWASVLMPVWSVTTGAGAEVLGLLFAAFSAASALGALCAAAWAARLPRFWVYTGGFLVAGLPRFVVFAVDSPVVAVVAVMVVCGFAGGFLNPIIGAVELERIPPGLLGRVSSLVSSMAWGLMPLGGLLGGVLVAWWGLPATLLVCGAAYTLVTLGPTVDPAWRDLDRRPGSAGEA